MKKGKSVGVYEGVVMDESVLVVLVSKICKHNIYYKPLPNASQYEIKI